MDARGRGKKGIHDRRIPARPQPSPFFGHVAVEVEQAIFVELHKPLQPAIEQRRLTRVSRTQLFDALPDRQPRRGRVPGRSGTESRPALVSSVVPECVIRTSAISKSFRGRPAVRGVSLEVERGSVYAFLGPNGAGKTTTIRMLLGLLRPDQGTIELFGRSLDRYRAEILTKTGSLVETPSVYPHLSARENLEIARRILDLPRSEIDRVLSLVGLENRSRHLVRTYSLGMKQRLGLALALLGQRELLLLDEPMNGLDPAGMNEMRSLIRDLPGAHGVTVVLSSHLLAEVDQVATHVGMLSQGEMVFQGPASALDRLRKPRLSIGVDRPAAATSRLAEHGWTADLVDERLVIAGEVDAAAVNRALVEHGHAVSHLAVESATLEDVFLSMTKAEVR